MIAQATELLHRYDCTIHDGNDGCDGHCAVTPSLLLSWYADDIAFVAEEPPATTLASFAEQLSTASHRMDNARIHGAEDLESASVYVSGAANTPGIEQAVLLKQASGQLSGLADMVDEYRDTL